MTAPPSQSVVEVPYTSLRTAAELGSKLRSSWPAMAFLSVVRRSLVISSWLGPPVTTALPTTQARPMFSRCMLRRPSQRSRLRRCNRQSRSCRRWCQLPFRHQRQRRQCRRRCHLPGQRRRRRPQRRRRCHLLGQHRRRRRPCLPLSQQRPSRRRTDAPTDTYYVPSVRREAPPTGSKEWFGRCLLRDEPDLGICSQ